MKKSIRLAALVTVLVLSAALLSACGASIPANSVFSVDDLPGKKIGVQLTTTGDIYASDYEEEGSEILRFSKGSDAIQALKQGKADCVIIDNEPAKVFVEKNKELKILDDPFTVEEYAIAVAKGNTELCDKINAALATLKDNGTMASITANYIGEEKGQHPLVIEEKSEYPNGTLTMATNAAFEPYEYYEGDSITGFDVDMMRAVCDILGMELQIEDMEFDSIITAVSTGKCDVGVAGLTVLEERLVNVDFTDSYTTATQVIIVRAE